MAGKGEIPQQSTCYQGNDEVPGQVLTRSCQPCLKNSKETAATVFCQTCKEFQCKDCSNVHTIYSFMSNHKLIDSSGAVEKTAAYAMNGLDRCEKHDKRVKFFCMDDKKLCCSTCAIIRHRKCNSVEEIKNITVQQSNINTLQANMNNLMEKNEAAAGHWTENESQIQEKVKDLLKAVDAVRTSVNNRLDDLERDINEQTTAISKRKAKEYIDNGALSKGIVTALRHDLEMLGEVRRQGNPEQLFIAEQRVTESFKTTKERAYSAFSKLESIDMCLELGNTLKKLVSATEKLGSVKLSSQKIKIDDIVEGRPVTLEKIVSIDVRKNQDDTKESLFTGMDFLPDGRLVVVDFNNSKCLVYSDWLEQLGSCELSLRPQSLAYVSKDTVAVAFGDVMTIGYLKIKTSNEIVHVQTIKTTSKYDSIYMKDDGHFVAGAYDGIKAARIVSLSGEEKDFGIDFPSKNFILDASTCAYIKSGDKVVLTDMHEDTVYIHGPSNNNSVIVKNDLIKKPRGVAIGPFDSIFVCSEATHTIVQISKTGKILSTYGLDICCPYRVCISKDKTKLAVTNNAAGQSKLQLYSIKY